MNSAYLYKFIYFNLCNYALLTMMYSDADIESQGGEDCENARGTDCQAVKPNDGENDTEHLQSKFCEKNIFGGVVFQILSRSFFLRSLSLSLSLSLFLFLSHTHCLFQISPLCLNPNLFSPQSYWELLIKFTQAESLLVPCFFLPSTSTMCLPCSFSLSCFLLLCSYSLVCHNVDSVKGVG